VCPRRRIAFAAQRVRGRRQVTIPTNLSWGGNGAHGDGAGRRAGNAARGAHSFLPPNRWRRADDRSIKKTATYARSAIAALSPARSPRPSSSANLDLEELKTIPRFPSTRSRRAGWRCPGRPVTPAHVMLPHSAVKLVLRGSCSTRWTLPAYARSAVRRRATRRAPAASSNLATTATRGLAFLADAPSAGCGRTR